MVTHWSEPTGETQGCALGSVHLHYLTSLHGVLTSASLNHVQYIKSGRRSKATWLGLGDNKHIHSVEYSFRAERRLSSASAPVCVSCNIIAEWTCVEWIFSSNRSVRLWAQWSQRTREPNPNWLKIDAALRDVARAIFIDRPPGELTRDAERRDRPAAK